MLLSGWAFDVWSSQAAEAMFLFLLHGFDTLMNCLGMASGRSDMNNPASPIDLTNTLTDIRMKNRKN